MSSQFLSSLLMASPVVDGDVVIKIKDELMRALKQWRQATADPLLDPGLLKQLTEEVQSVTSKSLARKHEWQYPRYFFSESP